MMKKPTNTLCLGTALFLFVSCNYVEPKGASVAKLPPDTRTSYTLGYNSLKTQIFAPKCISCHGGAGGVTLSDYASAKSVLQLIEEQAVVERAMPPQGPLTDDERALIQAWVDAGGPEGDVAGDTRTVDPETSPTPEPTPLLTNDPVPNPTPRPSSGPTPIPLVVHYTTVAQRIFTPYCVRCHGSSGGVNLGSYSKVKTYLTRVERVAIIDRSMPPSGPLSLQLRELLQSWIDDGAPQ